MKYLNWMFVFCFAAAGAGVAVSGLLSLILEGFSRNAAIGAVLGTTALVVCWIKIEEEDMENE